MLAHAARVAADARTIPTAAAIDARVDGHAIVALVAVDFGREFCAGFGLGSDAFLAFVVAVEATRALHFLSAWRGPRDA